MDEAAGPRRYQIKLDVPGDQVGTIFSALITQVEQPQLTQNPEGGHRITFVCTKDQLSTIIPAVNDASERIYIGPFNPEVKMQPAMFRPPRPVHVITPLEREITVVKPKRTRNAVAAKTKDTASGRAMLSAFDEGSLVKHPADFMEVLVSKGFSASSYASIANRLVAEGDLVRIGPGAYRRPTLRDTPGDN